MHNGEINIERVKKVKSFQMSVNVKREIIKNNFFYEFPKANRINGITSYNFSIVEGHNLNPI